MAASRGRSQDCQDVIVVIIALVVVVVQAFDRSVGITAAVVARRQTGSGMLRMLR